MNFTQEIQEKLQEAIKLYSLKGVHPAATIPPMMNKEEYQELVEDVRDKGFLHPAIITKDGYLLDGRNRLCASVEVGLDVRLEEFDPVDPISYVLSENKRRNLTPSQKAMMALKAEQLYAEEAKERQKEHGGTAPGKSKNTGGKSATSDEGKARDKAAKATGASPRSVSNAKAIDKVDPELAEKVRNGEITLNAALKIINRTKEQKRKALIQERIKTGKKPAGWDNSMDYAYDKYIKEEAEYRARMDKWRVEQEQKKNAKKDEANFKSSNSDSKPSESPSDSNSSDSFKPFNLGIDFLEEAKKFNQKNIDRQSFKEKIRISHQGKEDPFLDAILDYLETLDNNSRRIEACYNIIKICKGIAVDLQIKE